MSTAITGVLRHAGVDGSLAPSLWQGDASVAPRLPTGRTLALLMVDPVGIQDMVAASRRLITLSGASKALARWDDKLPRQLPEGWVSLFCGGGQAVLLGPVAEAGELAKKLVTAFQTQIHGRLVAAHLAVSPQELLLGPSALSSTPGLSPEAARSLGIQPGGGGGFGALLARLATLLRQRKDSGSPSPGPTVRPTQQRCAECGLRQATEKPQGPRKERLCRRCHDFHRQGVSAMENWEKRRLAYLSLDGTGIGERLFSCQSMGEYAAISRALHQAFDRQQVERHLGELGLPPEGVMLLVAGGDDLRLVLPASMPPGARATDIFHLALSVAQGVQDRFAQALPKAEPLQVGVGLVVTSHLDARQGLSLAWRLVRNAKVHAPPDTSAIDFEVVTGGSPVQADLATARKPLSRSMGAGAVMGAHFQLQLRPYPIDEAHALLEAARELNEQASVGRSTLYHLRQAFDEDPLEGLVTAQYLLSHLGDTEHVAAFMGLDTQALGRPLDADGWDEGWLYRKLGEHRAIPVTPADLPPPTWGTAIPDLVDICGIIAHEEAQS